MHAGDFDDIDHGIGGDQSPQYYFFMGGNLGWSQENSREFVNLRHLLKPHFKKWYYTGNGTDAADIEQTELGAPVAHIVNIFGNLSGDFVKEGGCLQAKVENGDGGWFGEVNGQIEPYDDDLTMFTMHDSPVAFSTLSGSANEETAAFSSGEAQGAPSDSMGLDSAYDDLQGGTDVSAFGDIEAGFKVDVSVPATQGYSRYNQYRYHHDYNGTKELNKDITHSNESVNRPGYGKSTSSTDTTGGAYYGQDGFGHYNMITTTWACNQDILATCKTRQDFDEGDSDSNPGRWRVFGNHGLDKYYNVSRTSQTKIEGTEHVEIQTTDSPNIKFGTGYCTYGWPGWNDTNDIDPDAGYYSGSQNVVLDTFGTNTDDDYSGAAFGTHFQNRKTVHCWSTTALTDSAFHGSGYSTLGGELSDANRNWKIWKSPRCSFRKLELPSGWDFETIKHIDMISWQKPGITSEDAGEIATGYLLQGPLSESPYSTVDDTMTGLVVIDNKRDELSIINGDAKDQDILCQSKASIKPIGALLKQQKIDRDPWGGAVKNHAMIAAYKNDSLLVKNLVPGLSDKNTSDTDNNNNANFSRTWYSKDTNYNVDNIFLRFNDVYSPIILGNLGESQKTCLSTWVRPQFQVGKQLTTDLGNGSVFPYYVCDKLFNYWATDPRAGNTYSYGTLNPDSEVTDGSYIAGFDRSIKKSDDTQDTDGSITTNSDLQPTEGWGSSAGSSKRTSGENNEPDGYYPISYSQISACDTDEFDEGANSPKGTHVKVPKDALLELIHEEPGTGDFAATEEISYKASYLYDGFQESPLSTLLLSPDPITANSKYVTLKLTLPGATQLGINARVTHINIYRKNNVNELYRLVKSISLDLSTDKFELVDGNYIHTFNDEARTATYEAINGIPESLTDLTPNYKLSCQLNDFLFISGIGHPKINKEGDHMIFRSKQGKFSIYDWSSDYLALPTTPIALSSFGGKLYAFSREVVYRINPEQFFIENKMEGLGTLNQNSVVSTDFGMFCKFPSMRIDL